MLLSVDCGDIAALSVPTFNSKFQTCYVVWLLRVSLSLTIYISLYDLKDQNLKKRERENQRNSVCCVCVKTVCACYFSFANVRALYSGVGVDGERVGPY